MITNVRFTDVNSALTEIDRLNASFIALPDVTINAPPEMFFPDDVVKRFCKEFRVYEPMIHDSNSLRVTGFSLVIFPHEYTSVRSKLISWFDTICKSGGNVEVKPTK